MVKIVSEERTAAAIMCDRRCLKMFQGENYPLIYCASGLITLVANE